jgi:vomeronasal 2 receptor
VRSTNEENIVNKEVSATKLDIFNYQSLQSGTKAHVKVGEFVFESHSAQHLSLNDTLITWGEHHNQVSVFEVSTVRCSQSGILQISGLKGLLSVIMLRVL